MRELLIYSDIGPEEWGGVSAKGIKAQLDQMQDESEITVRINSPGGDVFDGFAIYNLLSQHPAKITVKVDGWAASAASVIAMAGDAVDIAANALFMIHNPWTMAAGDAATMREQADLLDKIKASIITTYASKSSLDPQELSDLMDAETWFDAQGAFDAGFVTNVISKTDKAHKNTPRSWIRNAPAQAAPEPTYRIAARARFPQL